MSAQGAAQRIEDGKGGRGGAGEGGDLDGGAVVGGVGERRKELAVRDGAAAVRVGSVRKATKPTALPLAGVTASTLPKKAGGVTVPPTHTRLPATATADASSLLAPPSC